MRVLVVPAVAADESGRLRFSNLSSTNNFGTPCQLPR